jgi:23S rRNA (uracil1939-C5)-methyltransferase
MNKFTCPYAKKCGGCTCRNQTYEEQLQEKEKKLRRTIGKYCGNIHPVAGMYYPYHYRNKVNAAFGIDRRGNVISGTYSEGTHDIVPIESCLIEDKKADAIIGTIRSMLRSFKIKTYDEDTGYGLLRHVMVRRGASSGQIMVVLVTGYPEFPSRKNFTHALLEKHPEITTIIQNINDKNTSMVLGDREKVLYGPGYIEDKLMGYTFRISSRSFYQVNARQTEVLYKKAIAAAGLTGKETVIDAYCGIGTIGMAASRHAKKVIGIELNEEAVKDATENAQRNHVQNIQFVCADAGEHLTYMVENGTKADVILMDPPRSGSTEAFIDAVATIAPEKVVYISCNPETQARDLEYFKKKGYRAKEAWPVDMFGFTDHIENIVLLQKEN